MKRYGFIFLYFLALFPLAQVCANDTLSVREAFEKGLIRVSVKGNGGYQGNCIHLAVQNKTTGALLLAIPPGQLFPSKDSSVQDLVTTAPQLLALAPRATESVDIATMCTQSYNMGPRTGDAFSLGMMVEGHLLELVQLIASNNYQTSTAQSAVWSVANGDPVSSIYGSDTQMVRRVAMVVSEATGTPITDFHITPRRHEITAIRSSIECLIPKNLSHATLAVYDDDGNQIRRYFEDKAFEMGFMQFRIGLHHTDGPEAKFHLRLTEGEEVIASRPLAVTDTVVPLIQVHSQAVMNYRMEKEAIAEVGLYDEQGQLYLILQRGKRIPKGYHRATYIVGKALPAGHEYLVKIKVNGKTLAEQALDLDAPPPVRHAKRMVKGTFRIELTAPLQHAQLAVYDESGDMIRIFFEDSSLYPGKKALDYSFGHFQGPEARLFLRLTDGNGNVIQEELLNP